MLFWLTLLHFAVDGLCGAALASSWKVGEVADLLCLFALYNCIAFGGQWLAGLLFDLQRRLLPAAFPLACFALAAGLFLPAHWLWQAFFLGVGNCLFHAAGGSLILRSTVDYTRPGVFVSSGAIGLALGLQGFVSGYFFLGLVLAGTMALSFRSTATRTQIPPRSHKEGFSLFVALSLLLFCVIMRGFGVGSGTTSWILLFPIVFATGKALGGIVCDSIGVRKTILAVFLLSFFALQMEGLLSGILLALALNMTMPLTLRLAHSCLPNWPGFIFGLVAGCLLPGAFFGVYFGPLPVQGMACLVFLLLFAAERLIRCTETV